jgi:penicillin amidase
MLARRLLVLLTLLGSTTLACKGGGGGGEEDTGTTTDGEELGDPEVFPGLASRVEIVIDTRGIPHIYAEKERDLFHAAGYQVATDRLFQIDLLRRRAYGRGAEVLGEAKVDEDKISRLFDFKRWGKLDAKRMLDEAPEQYALFSAWVAGVNRRIDEIAAGDAPLPYGFGEGELDYAPEKWDNTDPFVIAKMIAFGNSNVLEYEFLASVVRQTTPDAYEALQLVRPGMPVFTMPPEDRPGAGAGAPHPSPGTGPKGQVPTAPLPPDAAAALRRMHAALSGFRVHGSNNWAVDGRFTEDGRPLIANDPHQPLESPSVMYALHLNTADAGGEVDVAGFGFAGAPGVQLGHNRHLQWAATTGFADCMDLLAVETSEDGSTANVGGEVVPVTERVEEIKVKDAEVTRLTVGDIEGHGVLLGQALPFPEQLAAPAGRHILVTWTGFRATAEPRAFLGMGRAENLNEWEAAVDLMEVGTFNFVAADKDGISYHLHTLVPDRGDPSARPMPYTVVDGHDPANVWDGTYLPATKLPQSRAEQTGFIVTANNDPFGFTADGDLGNDPWYYGAYYDPGYRAGRIEQRLKELTGAGKVSIADMQALQTDTHSGLADQLLPVLAEVYAKVPGDPALEAYRDRQELATLVDLMTIDWSREMQQDEPGALAFHAFAHFLAEETFADDLALTFAPVFEASAIYGLKFTSLAIRGEYPQGEALLQQGRDILVLKALAAAADWLIAEFGSVNPGMYTWGERHGTGFRNGFGGDLDGGWHPTHGGEDTVNVSSSKFFSTPPEVRDQFESNDGAVFRMVARFAEDGTPEAFVNFPRGNSGDPKSPHFGDTLEDWRDGKYTKFPFTRAEVDAAAERTIVLEP